MKPYQLFVLLFCAVVLTFSVLPRALHGQGGRDAVEAPTGFDNLTNGFVRQAQFDLDRAKFDDVESIESGLGPVYNAESCRECHQNPVTGGISQVTELRAGHLDDSGNFVEAPGGSQKQWISTNDMTASTCAPRARSGWALP